MRVLVTGGAGYIGSHFLKELRDTGYKSEDVLVVDNLSRGFKENLIFGNFIEADIKGYYQLNNIISDFKPELIVHFAALISVPESEKEQMKYYNNNVVGSVNLLNAAIKNNVKKFIFSSSAAVYGTTGIDPVSEDSILNAKSRYAKDKKIFEEVLKDKKSQGGDYNYIILRYFNVAGSDPRLEVGNRKQKPENLISIITNNLINKKYEINICGTDWDTSDGTGVRDYIHVSDIAKAHTAVIPLLEKGDYIFNVGYGKGSSVLEVIHEAEKATGIQIKRNYVDRRPGDVATSIANNSRIKKYTGWKPEYDDLKLMIKNEWDWENNLSQ